MLVHHPVQAGAGCHSVSSPRAAPAHLRSRSLPRFHAPARGGVCVASRRARPSVSASATDDNDDGAQPQSVSGAAFVEPFVEPWYVSSKCADTAHAAYLKDAMLTALRESGGDMTLHVVVEAVKGLSGRCEPCQTSKPQVMSGRWRTLSRPDYPDCMGYTEDGRAMFTLGRMSFNKFQPVDTKCVIEVIENDVVG